MATRDDVDRWFTPRSPDRTQAAAMQRINETLKLAATTVVDNTPVGPDQTSALRLLRNARMTANEAVMCEQVDQAFSQVDESPMETLRR